MKALIGDIGRYSLHDGPGIRTTVFFKGCNFHCPWCHNPEFIDHKRNLLYYQAHCIACGDCLVSCPRQALVMKDGFIKIMRELCDGCGKCVEACFSEALVMAGREYTVEELVEILIRDVHYYKSSGGGITLSGGEPTLQIQFIELLLQQLKALNIHTAIETNGGFSSKLFDSHCFELLDLIYFDLKISDPACHQQILKASSTIIYQNLERLVKLYRQKIVVRIPLVPGFTALESNLSGISKRLRQLELFSYELVPYHSYGLSKCTNLGMKSDDCLPKKCMEKKELLYWQEVMIKKMEGNEIREVEYAN